MWKIIAVLGDSNIIRFIFSNFKELLVLTFLEQDPILFNNSHRTISSHFKIFLKIDKAMKDKHSRIEEEITYLYFNDLFLYLRRVDCHETSRSINVATHR